mmetsp:Transcript_24914/g.31087  ORF Transcript_24914/g.31087 Transcript_24914/m.31087 type:complete len:171 (+) Transcript_24914:2-514(+)
MNNQSAKSKSEGFAGFTFLKKVDIFEADLPSFTLNGKSRAGTIFGGMVSLCIIYITFLFCSVKLVHLLERKNPTVNTYMRKDTFDHESKHSFKDGKFMMAFSFEDYFSNKSLIDTRYVKWFAYYLVSQGGVWDSRELPIYPCTDEDFAKFYPIDDRSETRFNASQNRADQ